MEGYAAVMSNDMLRFRKGDLLAVFFVLLLAAATAVFYLPKPGMTGAWAEIYQHNRLLQTVSLAEDRVFAVEGDYTNRIEVRQGKIGIAESDCPGADCVHSGFTGTPNRSIVCLPNGVEIRILGEGADVDFVVR